MARTPGTQHERSRLKSCGLEPRRDALCWCTGRRCCLRLIEGFRRATKSDGDQGRYCDHGASRRPPADHSLPWMAGDGGWPMVDGKCDFSERRKGFFPQSRNGGLEGLGGRPRRHADRLGKKAQGDRPAGGAGGINGRRARNADTEKPAKPTPSSSVKSSEKVARPPVAKFQLSQASDDGDEDAEEDGEDFFAEAVGKAASLLNARSRGDKREKARFENSGARSSLSEGRTPGNEALNTHSLRRAADGELDMNDLKTLIQLLTMKE